MTGDLGLHERFESFVIEIVIFFEVGVLGGRHIEKRFGQFYFLCRHSCVFEIFIEHRRWPEGSIVMEYRL